MVKDFWEKTAAIVEKHECILDISKATFTLEPVKEKNEILQTVSAIKIQDNMLIEDIILSLQSNTGPLTYKELDTLTFNDFIEVYNEQYLNHRLTKNYYADTLDSIFNMLDELSEYWETIKLIDVPQLKYGEPYNG